MRRRLHLQRTAGVTLAELVIVLVAITVLIAVAVPMWRLHLLRVRRADAIDALTLLQSRQDEFFGRHARYATGAEITQPPPEGLGLAGQSPRGYYDLGMGSDADGLGYRAIARAARRDGQAEDTRCAEFSLDQNGRRRASDSQGTDRSADCWR